MKALARRLAAAAAVLLPLVCTASGLDAESLDRTIRALDSVARETQALFASAAQGGVPSHYVQVQREELGKLARDAAKPLDEAGPSELAPRVARTKAASQKLADALANQDATAASGAARELDALAKGGR